MIKIPRHLVNGAGLMCAHGGESKGERASSGTDCLWLEAKLFDEIIRTVGAEAAGVAYLFYGTVTICNQTQCALPTDVFDLVVIRRIGSNSKGSRSA